MTNIIKHSDDQDWFRRPFGQLANMRREMDQLMDSFFGDSRISLPSFRNMVDDMPRINVRETSDSVIVSADVPGFTEDEIDVEVGDGYIKISGDHTEERESGDKNEYYRMERRSGSFSRVIGLPVHVNTETISADIDKGVLTVTLPKREQEKKTKVKVSKKK